MEIINEIKASTSLDLLEYIGWKVEYPEEAKTAFDEFCLRYDQDVIKAAEIYCYKWKYSEAVALDIVNCTFAKVWKYPTYDHRKSKSKSIDNGIKRWLYRIVFTQLANYNNKGTCHEPEMNADLSLVYTIDGLVDKMTDDASSRKNLRERLSLIEEIISQLGDKHRIIFLTYKLYTHLGNNIPRSVSKKLQEELELVPASIRKYKEQANTQVDNFLKRLNGNEK